MRKALQKGWNTSLAKDKERLDVRLVNDGYFQSRERAKAAIMAGLVFVNGQISDKAGNMIPDDAEIMVKGDTCPYVSRGGLKLEKAMKTFPITLEGAVCMDIGASHGGFTDCMLQNGAAKVYAVDVGYGQLDYKLRTDERVINMEKTNIRYVDPETIAPLDFVSIDVSFISLKLVFPVAFTLMKEEAEMVCLVKPQFEAGREQVGKNGIVRERKTHLQVLKNVGGYALENGFTIQGVDFSPVKGAKGNIEYLMFLKKPAAGDATADNDTAREALAALAETIVASSHEMLD